MTSHIYKNGAPLTALAKSLRPNFGTAIITKQVLLICALISSTMTMFLIVQPISAQQTLYIGSKNLMPEVIVNLDAIYGRANANFKTNIRSRQPNISKDYGNSRLLIPNLETKNKSRILNLRPSNTGMPAVSQATSLPAQGRIKWREDSAADASVAPTVMPLSSSIKGRDVSIAALPPLPQKSIHDRTAKSTPTSVLKKTTDKAKDASTKKEPKLIRAANYSKAPLVPTKKRLTPPPPPGAIAKAEASKLKLPNAIKLMTKKKEGPSVKSVLKPKTKLGEIAPLPSVGDKLLEVRFRSGSSVLTRKDEQLLIKMTQIIGPTAMRLQLKAFAEASGNNSSKARRLSLSRALAVRSFLIENGLRSTRIDVRALGIARDGGGPDRVDIVPLD